MALRFFPLSCAVYALFGAYLLQGVGRASVITPVFHHTPDLKPEGFVPAVVALFMIWGGFWAWYAWAFNARFFTVAAAGLSIAFPITVFAGVESPFCLVLYLTFSAIVYGIGFAVAKSAKDDNMRFSRTGSNIFLALQILILYGIVLFPATGRSPKFPDIAVGALAVTSVLSIPAAWIIGRFHPSFWKSRHRKRWSRLALIPVFLPLLLAYPSYIGVREVCSANLMLIHDYGDLLFLSYVTKKAIPFPLDEIHIQSTLTDATNASIHCIWVSSEDDATLTRVETNDQIPVMWSTQDGLHRPVRLHVRYSMKLKGEEKLTDIASIRGLLQKIRAADGIRMAQWRPYSQPTSFDSGRTWTAMVTIDEVPFDLRLTAYSEYAYLEISTAEN